MKHIVTILSALVLFASCKNGDEKPELKETDKIASVMEPAIQGSWVMEDYITDLQKTKSPLASSAKLEGLVSIDIDTRGHTGDSSSVSGSLNNHEGVAFYVYFRKGQNGNAIPTNYSDNEGDSYELDYTVVNADTMLIMYHYDKAKKLLDKRNYTKWKEPVADYDEPSGLQRFANTALLAGKYKATDDKGKVYNWELSKGGNLIGVEGHNTYYIFTDFLGEGDGYKIDELCFDKSEKTQKPFIFEIKGDTVLFYGASEDKERTKLIKGELKYTLVKQ